MSPAQLLFLIFTFSTALGGETFLLPLMFSLFLVTPTCLTLLSQIHGLAHLKCILRAYIKDSSTQKTLISQRFLPLVYWQICQQTESEQTPHPGKS